MSKLIILGLGTVGTTAAETIVGLDIFSEVILGDIRTEVLKNLSKKLGEKVSYSKVDVSDKDSVLELVENTDVVLNCVGPFYKYGPLILSYVIDAGVNYVDICDDMDATIEMLKMDNKAREKNISALIGMGSSPGLANLFVKFAADALLDEVESVDIYHAHGGEVTEGPAVVKHRIHSMLMDIPVFLDGKYKTVRLFDKSGKSLEEETDFPVIGRYKVYAYPHPETITLPKYIDKGLRRVTNLGLVLPPEYAELIKNIVRLGLVDEKPIDVGGVKISPLDFSVSYILSKRREFIEKAGLKEPVGSLKIVVKGYMKDKKYSYIFALSSKGQGMGEGTGIPAAIGAALMGMGKIAMKGVFPPEAGVNPFDVITLASKILSKSGRELPLIIERMDEEGNVKKYSFKDLFF